MNKYEGVMDLGYFVEQEESHVSTMQFWINSDEDSIVLDYDLQKGGVSARIITSKIYDFEGDKKDAHAWGIPFEDIARFVDAVRAIKPTQPA